MKINARNFINFIFPVLLLVITVIFPKILNSNYWLNLINLAISYSVACIGLNIVLGYAGQLSLAQAGFWGLGAYTSAILTTQFGVPVWIGLIASFIVAGLFGILLGIPTLKLTGHYLAMATIGFGIILQIILINTIWLTKGSDGIPNIPSPSLFSFELKHPNTFFYVAIFILILLTLIAIRIKNSRIGRSFMAIRENEMAAETMGVDSTYYKIMAFALSAGYAGIGGWMFAHSCSHYISPDTFSFGQSVLLLSMAVVGGIGSAIGAIIGATLLTLVPEFFRFLKDYYMMFYAACIVLIMIFMPGGITDLIVNLSFIQKIRRWWLSASTVKGAKTGTASKSNRSFDEQIVGSIKSCSGSEEILLKIEGLTKRFGGLVAVENVNITISRGKIQALIGPNGSGKTTILNMLSGLYFPTAGTIHLNGINLTGKKPHAITSFGIARTFQNIRLFGELSVIQNVLIGQHYHFKSGLLSSILRLPAQKDEEEKMHETSLEILEFVGLQGKEFHLAKSLPYGQQRMLELARALSSRPKLLLLDEPAAGLNTAETEILVDLLSQICKRGITILLVEHDMNLVMTVSDHITVLNFGRKIAEGSCEMIENNQEVIDAYLGREIVDA
jgi:branched-chain amino acid transport system permease protein